jgi:hypothetical protein
MDTWEGDPLLDERGLYGVGVRGNIIRMNQSDGSMRLDVTFKTQWAQSTCFYRMPYIVYGSWYDQEQVFEWIMANIPPEARAIALDIELDAFVINPVRVATNLLSLITKLKAAGLKVIDYSGTWWWLPTHIAEGAWMKNEEYWWASYPKLLQPDNARHVTTWAVLIPLLNKWVWDDGGAPGHCVLRQVCSCWAPEFTGGVNIDINLFKGSRDDLTAAALELELKSYFGGIDVTPLTDIVTTPGSTFTVTPLVSGQNIRATPGTGAIAGTLTLDGKARPVLDMVTIKNLGVSMNGVWVRIAEGWIALQIQSTVYQTVKMLQS